MKIRIVKLLNLIRFRVIGTILLSITITVNAIEATAPNIDYRFIIPILVMGGVLLIPLIRGRRIVGRIYRRGINQYNSRLIVCILFILGFHNKLVGIPIVKKSFYGWLFLGFWVIGSIITFIWMYSNNVSIWILCISMIIAIYKILKSLFS
ncbi:hypothetical protein [uncultured Veillonella sp.]|uniref:hypothetical protein n=1 Tax=uncultured Veillonella sp. TaxID=159268 RepID=UPI00280411D4|nr:hypothetical protein [uncultured Veillonella sp.]